MNIKRLISTLAFFIFFFTSNSVNSKENYIACILISLNGTWLGAIDTSSINRYFLIDTTLNYAREIGSPHEGGGNKSELSDKFSNNYNWIDVIRTGQEELALTTRHNYMLSRDNLYLTELTLISVGKKTVTSINKQWECNLTSMEYINDRIKEEINKQKI